VWPCWGELDLLPGANGMTACATLTQPPDSVVEPLGARTHAVKLSSFVLSAKSELS